jgi:hypothetical protein
MSPAAEPDVTLAPLVDQEWKSDGGYNTAEGEALRCVTVGEILAL